MDIPDLLGLLGGIAGVLSLIASIFSAAGAARSADMASAVERRAAARDKAESLREAGRVAAAIRAESVVANAVVNEHEGWLRGNAAAMGNSASSRHGLALAEIEKRRKAIETFSAEALTFEEAENLADPQLAERVRSMDNALIHLEALRQIAQREADREQRERDRIIGRGLPNAPGDR
jgi:hypothetical protein